MRTPLPLSFAFLLSACFSADPSQVILKCDSDHPCPQGMECLSNQTCGQGSDSEMGMSSADAGADMKPVNGCKMANGQAIGRAWACPTPTLAKGQASTLCASGFKLCKSGADIQGDAQCKTISGFYAADLIGTTAGSPETAQCGNTANPFQVFYGCGRVQLNTIFQVNTACQQFERAIDCNYTGTNWTCGRTLDDTSTGVAAGVLCCPESS